MDGIKTILVTQARTGSTRLPGKVLLKIGEKELLKFHLDRLRKCKKVDQLVVATTINEEDNIIEALCNQWAVNCTRGSENDVLDRFYQSVRDMNAHWVVRVTSDCPLIDPDLVDAIISYTQENDADYGTNVLIENFPDGQDVEVFKFGVLHQAWKEAKLQSEREHVTPYIRKHADFNGGNLFHAVNYPCNSNYSRIRMTVDEPRDFELVQRLLKDLGSEESWLTYTNYIIENNLDHINANIVRNEGFIKSLKND